MLKKGKAKNKPSRKRYHSNGKLALHKVAKIMKNNPKLKAMEALKLWQDQRTGRSCGVIDYDAIRKLDKT